MAETANSAYMLWRQFSGEAKAAPRTNLDQFRPGQQQGEVHMGPNMGDQLRSFVNSAGDFFNANAKLKAEEEKQADKRVTSWMSQHTMQEYRQKMREGNVPFQNDQVAMDILHNNAAYGVALEVEEAIQNKVKAGEFKTIEEAESARIEALNGARSEYALSMGISPDGKAFVSGFDRQAEERRKMLVSLQQDVTDKQLRTQAKIAARSTILAPLTDDFVKNVSPETTAAYVVNTVKNQQTLGQIRSDADAAEVMAAAVESLKGTAGGAAALKALGQQEFELYGQKAKLRDHLGGGVFDAAVIGALDREQQIDSERQGGLNVKLIGLQRSNDIGGLVALRNDLHMESGGKMTSDIRTVDATIKSTEAKLMRENAAAMEQHAKNVEKLSRRGQVMETYRQFVAGDLDMVSPDGKDLGAKDAAEAREFQQDFLNTIQDPQEKFRAAVKLAGWDKDGFAANALKSQDMEASAAWDQFVAKLSRGDTTATVPEKVTAMQELYQGNPEQFTMVYKDPAYIQALELGKATGASPQDVAMSQVAWGKLKDDAKKEATKELQKAVQKVGPYNAGYVNESLKVLSAPYLQMGMPPETAVKYGKQQFEKQVVRVLDAPIHKGFFQVSDDPRSFEQGRTIFDGLLGEARKTIGDPRDSMTAISFDQTNQLVRIHNLQTGEVAQVTKGDLTDKAQVLAEEAEKKSAAAMEKQIKDSRSETAKNKAQQKTMNRLEGVNILK